MLPNMRYYLILILLIANLFYKEFWGLNALITAVLIIIVNLLNKQEDNQPLRITSVKWWTAALLLIANGFGVFYTNTLLAAILFIISVLYFAAINNQNQHSLILGIIQSMRSFFHGFYNLIDRINGYFKNKKETKSNNTYIRFLLISVPFLIAIIFLKLYQSADKTFYEWTKFINLDWVSWSFIFFYLGVFVFSYGLYFFSKSDQLFAFEQSLKNLIPTNYADKVQNFMGVDNEKKIALSLLITLNLLLLLYNFIDLRFVFTELQAPSPTLRYSETLHGGVNSLITSIVLVIIIITFIFRGQVNFQKNTLLKALALFWLFMNLIMVATTTIKNWEYITHWGLTYKRIGVYIYLSLAAIGLVLTIFKIIKIQSIWYLIRSMSITFFACFTLMGIINWDRIIVNYNLSHIPVEKVDIAYLMKLGEEAYPPLLEFTINHPDQFTAEETYEIRYFFDAAYLRIKDKHDLNTWRSLNIRQYTLLEEMKRISPKIPNTISQAAL